ncbi:helix-turn-helix transcriptional regulator [Buttiauxella izardii]|nr:helix-turn-helix transcriptional regulator [Buttiauxella izardii]
MARTRKLLYAFRSESDVEGAKLARPVFFRSFMMAEDVQSEVHAHPFIQFHYAREGALYVTVENTSYIMPACYGLWIPAHVPHHVHTASEVFLESVDIDPDFYAASGGTPELKLVAVTDFARSFIHHATQTIPEFYDEDGKEGRLVTSLLDVLNDLPEARFGMTWPTAPALQDMCQTISESPDQPHLMEEWAERVGMSPRTFSRHFIKETGTTFGNWKQRNRLLQSIMLLRQSKSVTEIALMLGYSSTSAYTYAFRQLFGVSPTKFEAAPLPPSAVLHE